MKLSLPLTVVWSNSNFAEAELSSSVVAKPFVCSTEVVVDKMFDEGRFKVDDVIGISWLVVDSRIDEVTLDFDVDDVNRSDTASET